VKHKQMGKRTKMSPTHLIRVTTANMFETIVKKCRVNENRTYNCGCSKRTSWMDM